MVYETGFTQELTTDEDNVRARGSIEFDDWSSLLDDIARETIKNATETARPLAQNTQPHDTAPLDCGGARGRDFTGEGP